MSGSGLSYGLKLSKKPTGSRPQPAKRKPIFGGDDDSDGEGKAQEVGVEEIGDFGETTVKEPPSKPKSNGFSIKPNGGKPKLGANGSKKAPISMYGDLSSSLTSKKHADTAEELDANIYEYDAVYDSLKPQKKNYAG